MLAIEMKLHKDRVYTQLCMTIPLEYFLLIGITDHFKQNSNAIFIYLWIRIIYEIYV